MTSHYLWTWTPERSLEPARDDTSESQTDASVPEKSSGAAAESDSRPESDRDRAHGPGRGYGETPRQTSASDGTSDTFSSTVADGVKLLEKIIGTDQPVEQGLERSNNDTRLFEMTEKSVKRPESRSGSGDVRTDGPQSVQGP